MASWYEQKLQHPKWQRRRLEIFMRDDFTCVSCGSKDITLHVHHKDYIKGRRIWEYSDNELETLCKICHAKEHDLIPEEQYERKYQHLIVQKQESSVITAINFQLKSLENKLKEKIEDDLMEDILKNIMFLTNKKKELLHR